MRAALVLALVVLLVSGSAKIQTSQFAEPMVDFEVIRIIDTAYRV
tara:strand:- start:147 stop:281 length:135 start_codon:yes stop_codon:yes gene_type:complete